MRNEDDSSDTFGPEYPSFILKKYKFQSTKFVFNKIVNGNESIPHSVCASKETEEEEKM